MDQPTPSREIRRRLMLSIHQDGLLDILAGLIIATFGMIPLLDATGMNTGVRSVIFLSCYLLEVVVILWLKQAITLPRTGLVTLSRRTSSRLGITMLVINVLLFILFGGSILFKLDPWALFGSYSLSVSLGMIFLVLLSASGILLGAIRYYLYAMVVMAIFILSEHLFLRGAVGNNGIPLASFVSGGLIAGSGGILLVRFLRSYRIVR